MMTAFQLGHVALTLSVLLALMASAGGLKRLNGAGEALAGILMAGGVVGLLSALALTGAA